MGHRKIPYKTILAAKTGDAEAMGEILRHYDGYINACSCRTLTDEDGIPVTVIDEEIKARIQARLMYCILFEFDPLKPPNDK